jgi:hypothetical protein
MMLISVGYESAIQDQVAFYRTTFGSHHQQLPLHEDTTLSGLQLKLMNLFLPLQLIDLPLGDLLLGGILKEGKARFVI